MAGTGDVATMDDEGYFRVVDRKKDVINTAGFKVWPREVEEVLYAHQAVKLVAGGADDYRGESVRSSRTATGAAWTPAS